MQHTLNTLASARLVCVVTLIASSLHSSGCRRDAKPARPAPASTPAWFTDVTDAVGLEFVHQAGATGTYFYPEIMGSGCALFDYDADGDLDIYIVNGAEHEDGIVKPDSRMRNHLFRREDDGTYHDVTDQTELGDTGYGMGVAVADVDNDDDLDVYVTNFGRNRFYRNDGDGTFTDDTVAAGFDTVARFDWSCSAAFLDYDRDGAPDLFVTNYLKYDAGKSCRDRAGAPDYCGPMAFEGVPDVLYHNNGDGTFTDVSVNASIGSVRGRGLGVVCEDFDEDGSIDIFVANDGEANHLWINRGDGTFRDEAMTLGAALNEMGQAEASMGIAVGDVDLDGHIDLFCTHLRNESNTLYHGAGARGFADATATAGLGAPSMDRTGFGAAFADLDHDGAPEIVIVNGRVKRGPASNAAHLDAFWRDYAEPNQVFSNGGTKGFADACPEIGAFCSTVDASRGLAVGDIDDDGDLDFLVSNGSGRARLYRNDTPKHGHWLMVAACAPGRSTPELGAAIDVEADGRWHHGTVRTASSYLSAGDSRVHFGLGAATAVSNITVRWSDGTVEAFGGGAVDRHVRVERGGGKVESRKQKTESRKPIAEREQSKTENRESKTGNRKPKSGRSSVPPSDSDVLTLTPPTPDLTHAQKPVAEKIERTVALVNEDPRSADPWGHLGMVYLAHGFAEEAATCLGTAEELDPNDFRWPHLLSHALPKSDLDAVMAAVRRGIALKPDFVFGHLRLAQFLIQRGSRAQARKCYEAVLALAPDNAHACLGLGQIANAEDDFEAAVGYLERARATAPDYREVCAALSQTYRRTRRLRDAELAAARARALPARLIESDDPLVHMFQAEAADAASLVRRGSSLVRRGRVDEGLRMLRSAVEIAPETAVNHRALGAGLTAAGEHDAALAAIGRALELDPDRPRILIDRGVALNAAGRYDEALACFARIVAIDPLNEAAWYDVASVQARLGDHETAITSFVHYSELNPGDHRAYRNLAVLYSAGGMLEKAAAEYRRSIEYEPFAAGTYLELSGLEARRGDHAAAATVLREGIRRLPGDANLSAALERLATSEE